MAHQNPKVNIIFFQSTGLIGFDVYEPETVMNRSSAFSNITPEYARHLANRLLEAADESEPVTDVAADSHIQHILFSI